MKTILKIDAAKDIYCHDNFDYVIASTGNSVDFYNRDLVLLKSISIADGRICDVSEDGRFVAISSFMGIFIVDIMNDMKVRYINPQLSLCTSKVEDQVFRALFVTYNVLIICASLMYTDMNISSELLNDTAFICIDVESGIEKAKYIYSQYSISDFFKSRNVLYAHIHHACTGDDAALSDTSYNYETLLLKIDSSCILSPVETKLLGVNRVFDYDAINHRFIVQKANENNSTLKSIEIVDDNMKSITSYFSRIRLFDVGWSNNGKSIVICSMLGGVVLDSAKMKPKARIKELMIDFPKHRFDSPYVTVISTKKAILYKDE